MALTKARYRMLEGQSANVIDYGADPTGVNDSTTAFNAAIATGKKVIVPEGTFLVNAQINNKTVIEGAGSTVTFLKPYNVAIAALTYNYAAMLSPISGFWNYHSEIRNIGFIYDINSPNGVGFTFGKTDPSNYVTNDEKANNVKFYGCYFTGLDKGIQFPFGNIGTEIYSCGFQLNKYGIYMLNNKFGGSMHCGNKYVYAGEFSSNTCAVYIHNSSSGFGGITFDNTIMEFNNMAVYSYSDVSSFVVPTFREVWFEGNGTLKPSTPATIDIDAWSGSTKSTQTVPVATCRLDGTDGTYVFNGGFFTGVKIVGTNIQVYANNVNGSILSGTAGEPCSVNDATSSIVMDSPRGAGALPRGRGQIVKGHPKKWEQIGGSALDAQQAWFNVAPRLSKASTFGDSLVFAASGTSVISTGSGSFNLSGSVVSDGQLYATCNEFTRAAFGSAEYTRITSPNSELSLAAGYHVLTFDAKITAGNVEFLWWNRSTETAATAMVCETLNEWYTFASIVKAAGTETIFFDIKGTGVDATWRLSSIQIHSFATLQQAQNFLASGVYAES